MTLWAVAVSTGNGKNRIAAARSRSGINSEILSDITCSSACPAAICRAELRSLFLRDALFKNALRRNNNFAINTGAPSFVVRRDESFTSLDTFFASFRRLNVSASVVLYSWKRVDALTVINAYEKLRNYDRNNPLARIMFIN